MPKSKKKPTKKFYPPAARVSTKGLSPQFIKKQRHIWNCKSRKGQLAHMRAHPCSVLAKRYGLKAA